MVYPSLRFVATPDEAATVRLDLNALAAGVDVQALHDGFNLGMSTLDGEPGARGRRWGNRKVAVPLLLVGPRASALSTLKTLAREAARDGWVRWQLDATTAPVWFRVYASSPEPLGFDLMMNGSSADRWKATLSMDADPFGVGVPVVLGPYTITNNPESGTNPMSVTLPAITGEMPATTQVRITKAATGGMLGPAAAVSMMTPVSVTAASWQSVVDAATTSTAYIAGAYRQTNATLTTTWANVCTFTPSTSIPVGRRRALLRVSGSASAGAFLLRWVAASPAATSQVTTDPVLVSVAQMQRYVDTGILPFPLGDGAALGITPTTVYTLQAKRAATGGELRFDQRLLLLGVDDTTLQVAAPGDVGTGAADLILDGDARVSTMSAGGNLVRPPATRGGWPAVRPGETNVLFVAQNLDAAPVTSRDDSITSTTSVTVTYRPRYLWGVG